MDDVLEGECRLCAETYGRGMTNHIQSCLARHAERAATSTGLHLSARADGPTGRFWMHLLVSPDASLADLDAYVRSRWFDGGRISQFETSDRRYVSDPRALPDPVSEAEAAEGRDDDRESGGGDEEDGETDDDGADASPEKPIESLDRPVGATVRPRMDFEYQYGARRPTRVELTVYDPYPVPDDLEESAVDGVFVVARNDAPAFDCHECGARASFVRSVQAPPDESVEEGTEAGEPPGPEETTTSDETDEPEESGGVLFLCADCARVDDPADRELGNTPRAGRPA